MGKTLVCFLFFFISIQMIDSIILFRHFNIEIYNDLGGKQKLMVHCKDKEGSTEVVFLRSHIRLRVRIIIFPRTLIWCNLWKGPNYEQHMRFTAFVETESFIHDVCGSRKPNVCFWQVQDDGVWARHNPTGALKLMYKWDHKL
ncbi:hypothetical protein EUTSA_v10002237mg [Eutrema salsugineum]|uniref:Uncharacterized protein n=1 Tax=Eutrema salsugineum TaxID=72664 RepID=V4M5B5_EUTSA|nr:S-protein homolog 21 [Eutrema salsugineum]ESQ50142.1 hypothetical protein EUTSA_v10002237mg [Eutrema salsugineum]